MKLAIAASVAVVIAVVLAVPSMYGIETWKWVLGLAGLLLFILAGRRSA